MADQRQKTYANWLDSYYLIVHNSMGNPGEHLTKEALVAYGHTAAAGGGGSGGAAAATAVGAGNLLDAILGDFGDGGGGGGGGGGDGGTVAAGAGDGLEVLANAASTKSTHSPSPTQDDSQENSLEILYNAAIGSQGSQGWEGSFLELPSPGGSGKSSRTDSDLCATFVTLKF